ncbi:hypothetical protein [Streptomyces fragilis]|uniref:Uncharacterized protein n=1 Tax=Streptomyces fragilis TaxID=67301 RepID=A0ABV2YD94_9ACTN|nr:hypothetical protein [Streptomyces fragilis]
MISVSAPSVTVVLCVLAAGLAATVLGVRLFTRRGSARARARLRRRHPLGDTPTAARRVRRAAIGWTTVGTLLCLVCAALLVVTHDPQKARFEARDPYRSCGDVTLAQGQELGSRAKREIGCLRRAHDRDEGAELKVTALTVEGDPVREYYRVTPHGALEIYTDSTDDPWSDGRWSSSGCDDPDWNPEPSCSR